MVKHNSPQLDAIFHALSDGTRRAMLSRLAQEELTVTELAKPYSMSLAAVSKHLKVLESAHFIKRNKEGRTYRCRADLTPLSEVSTLLEELGAHWRGALNTLADYLENEGTTKGKAYDRTPQKKS